MAHEEGQSGWVLGIGDGLLVELIVGLFVDFNDRSIGHDTVAIGLIVLPAHFSGAFEGHGASGTLAFVEGFDDVVLLEPCLKRAGLVVKRLNAIRDLVGGGGGGGAGAGAHGNDQHDRRDDSAKHDRDFL